MNKLYAINTTGITLSTKRIILLFLIFSMTLLSTPASANQLSTVNALTAEYNSESCIKCHEDTHKGWKRSWHSRSIIDPRVLRTWKTFILSGLDQSEGSRRDLKDICLPCHAPQTKDASDDLVREIAGIIITAVEEIDTYETGYKAVPSEIEVPISEIEEVIPSFMPAEDLIITDIKDELEIENTLTLPDDEPTASPWIRDEVDTFEDISFGVFEEEQAPDFIKDNISNKAEDSSAGAGYEIAVEPVKSETLDKSEAPPLEPIEDMTATIVVDDGKVKIEYSPYDPKLDHKEPTFLDKGVTVGEIARDELSKLNINCMICHSMKALPGGNPMPRTIYGTGGSGSIEHKEALGAETRISGFMKTSEFCAQCHHGCPPGMPSSICPTLWTSYKEDYVARGGDKTCQDCHMSGPDKKSHRFPGIYETELVKTGIFLTLDAEPTRHIYHLENRIVPAVLINVNVLNTAGHSIPHGCTYIPQTKLEVSVRDQNGNVILFKEKTYGVYNLHLPHNKEGYLGLNDWDITAMTRINQGINPGDTDSNTYMVPLNENTTSVVIEAVFKYLYEEDVSSIIHKETREIELEIDKMSPRM